MNQFPQGGNSVSGPLGWAAALALALLICLAWLGVDLQRDLAQKRLLLLPMIGALDNCLLSRGPTSNVETCGGDTDSAAGLIEGTLNSLGPRRSADGIYEVGYTLNVPLLRLFTLSADGRWVIDEAAAKRVANTIRRSERPMVLYMFSTHFSVGGALEKQLGADPRNLAYGPTGQPMDKGRYYHLDIYPWSVVDHSNSLTRMRETAINAVLEQVCQLPWRDRKKVHGVTVLGELHHLFPDFESGMGVSTSYQVSDYSDQSIQGFRQFLRERFVNVRALNEAVGGDYRSFDEVVPPAKDIRTQRLSRYQDHIDSYATGVLPISGWAHEVNGPSAKAPWIHIFVNGLHVARVPANLARQDVFTAVPSVGAADVGWRYDLNYSAFAKGMHRIDVALEPADGGAMQYLSGRWVGVMGRDQAPPRLAQQSPLPPMSAKQSGTSFWLDTPSDQLSLYYNPLVLHWHEYRQRQVTDYLKHFAGLVRHSCLGSGPVYTHQIVPFANPGWDASRFAIDDSLGDSTGMRLGISLYGRATYGPEMIDWLRSRRSKMAGVGAHGGSRAYGVTEFHPLKAMSAQELNQVLTRHYAEGAQFISFFMEPRVKGKLFEPGINLFSFDPQNTAYGSDSLYEAMANILRAKSHDDPSRAVATGSAAAP
nr:beta-galactosidase [uncultured Acidovorax sp.]